jgi:hypothetical protein
MTIQIQQLLFCATVFIGIGCAGMFFAAKERREAHDARAQVFEGKVYAGEAVYRVDPVMTKEGVIFVRAGKARDVGVAKRSERAEEPKKGL